MYAGKDFTAGTPGEADVFGFDYARRLDVGDTIDTATWSAFAVTYDGTGAEILTPVALTVGNAVNLGTVTRQKFASFPAGSYVLQASITSLQGRGPLLYWSRLLSEDIS